LVITSEGIFLGIIITSAAYSTNYMGILKRAIIAFIFIIYSLIMLGQVNLTSSDLPIIIINTNGEEIPDEPKMLAEMKIIYDDDSTRNSIAEPIYSYNGKIRIEIRGATSQYFPKKQYAFKTCDFDGDELNVNLLNLPRENDWILYAPYSDKSLIRNVLAYNLARETGQYASRARFCELILNGEYMGVYVLFEKIKQDISRVDISRLASKDISGDALTGGYILKIDKEVGNNYESFYSSYSNTHFQYHYPDHDDMLPEQKTYIENFIREFELALFFDNYQDPQNGYYRYIDMNSFVDYMIVNELAKNIDAYRWSTFMYKKRDSKGGKLYMGPVWDFNIAFGNVDYLGGYHARFHVIYNHPWWTRLNSDPAFKNALVNRWNELRSEKLTNERVLSMIDSLANTLMESSERNFTRWEILGEYIWPNYYIGENYSDEIDFLKNWVIDRLHWLDFNISETADIYSSDYNNALSSYPNPFTDNLTVIFELENSGVISLKIYDILGHLRDVIISERYCERGIYTETFTVEDGSFFSISQGMYIVTLEKDNRILSRVRIIKH
jgi:hypothetical protein